MAKTNVKTTGLRNAKSAASVPKKTSNAGKKAGGTELQKNVK